ncbi:MAG: DUF2461 family protein [Acutalibacteraceae bacterium]
MYPCMWFEVTPRAWSCGVGTYEVSADYMEVFREHLRNGPEGFKKGSEVGARHGSSARRRVLQAPEIRLPRRT